MTFCGVSEPGYEGMREQDANSWRCATQTNKRPHRASLAAHHMPGKADRQRILIEKQKEGFQYLFKKIDPKYNRKKIFFNFNM